MINMRCLEGYQYPVTRRRNKHHIPFILRLHVDLPIVTNRLDHAPKEVKNIAIQWNTLGFFNSRDNVCENIDFHCLPRPPCE